MKKVIFLIADASIELVDKYLENKSKSKIRRLSDRLLDISHHYHLIRKNHKKHLLNRGRPDIIHFGLLLLLDSILNKEKMLEVYIHTVDNYIIYVNPEVRLPKNYERFKGLMADLLIRKKIHADNGKTTLLAIQYNSITSFINQIKPSIRIGLTRHGIPTSVTNLTKQIILEKNPLIVVGGFQKGTFSKQIAEIINKKVSIDPQSLHLWTVISKIVATIENILNLDKKRFKNLSGAGAGI